MPNALQHETSPYLLQHANNPVDWMPWGDAALAKAKSENKLLLISIGYAACHWCHVMERESFERDDVAAVMNANFVCIKVDREERPDVDDVYMLACQLSGGGGCGWPLNSVALPDGRPVWAGTYFPRERWIELLNNFTTIRQQEPERLEAYARQIGEQLQVAAPIQILDVQPFGAAFLDRAAKSIVNLSDPRWGGFGGAPKFPLPIGYAFLLDYLANSVGDEGLRASVAAVTQQGLLALARGGIYDQLGGGWSRYAVDIRWHVPHFEKMLYDNAQLLSVFARAFRQNPLAEYAAVLHETVGFLARELRAEPGFFYSSLDADSEGEEGKFYVWTDAELSGLLSAKELALTQEIYALRPGGNWADGKHILHRPEGWQALDTNTGKIDVNMEATAAERTSLLASLRAKLFAARSQRVRPALDDKILVSWNGLLISGLVDVHLALGQASPALGMAERAAHALVATFLQPDGRLLRTHAKGRTHINAFLDDYANFGQGLLDLYSVTFDEHWLRLAERLVDYALTHFCEDGRPLLFYTSDLDQQLVARRLEEHDNVMPSSNSVMAGLLFSLGHTLGRYQWVERAEDMLREVEPEIRKARQSLYWSRWMQVYLRLSRPHFEVAIVGPEALSLRQAFAKTSFPTVTFLGSLENSQLNTLEGKYLEGQTWIYVCQRGSCQEPTQVLAKALDQIHESTIK